MASEGKGPSTMLRMVPLPCECRGGFLGLVGLFCSRDMREAVLGDLDEKFAELAERRGVRIAKAWY